MKDQIIEGFSTMSEEELMFFYSLSVAANKLMQAADSLPNVIKASLLNSCGHMTAYDGTKYQAKVMLVADQNEWRDKDIVEVITPDVQETTKALSINDIN